MLALFIDPLYVFVPSIGGNKDYPCPRTDTNLRLLVTFFRIIADLFYLLHIFIKLRTSFVAPNSSTGVFGRGEFVMDPEAIAWSPKTKMNTGVMVLASRFAANTRRGIAAQRPRFKKPEDPDFSAEPDD
ncbi:hypothetical protein YC2023_032420 [Brassica napus]